MKRVPQKCHVSVYPRTFQYHCVGTDIYMYTLKDLCTPKRDENTCKESYKADTYTHVPSDTTVWAQVFICVH